MRARVHPRHDGEDVERRADVEDLKEKVPQAQEDHRLLLRAAVAALAVVRVLVRPGERVAPEQVQVARAEEDGVQGLGDERDACERELVSGGEGG